MPKGVETKFKLGMRRLNDQSHFVYLLKNPNLLLPVREAFIREAAHTQDAEVAEEISKRDLWKMEVVEKAKFHYNYSYPEPIVEVQSTSEKDTISRTKSRTPLPVHLYPYTLPHCPPQRRLLKCGSSCKIMRANQSPQTFSFPSLSVGSPQWTTHTPSMQ